MRTAESASDRLQRQGLAQRYGHGRAHSCHFVPTVACCTSSARSAHGQIGWSTWTLPVSASGTENFGFVPSHIRSQNRILAVPITPEGSTEATRAHWNDVYSARSVEELGWYETIPEPSLGLIEGLSLPRDAEVLDVGSGCSTLIPALLSLGYTRLTALDVSEVALAEAQRRLGVEAQGLVRWIQADVTRETPPVLSFRVDLWHDRALFHFLLTEAERRAYMRSLWRYVLPGGHVILATFSQAGLTQCSGLDVRRYDAEMLEDEMGEDFALVRQVDHVYVTPSGQERPYIYSLFIRGSGER